MAESTPIPALPARLADGIRELLAGAIKVAGYAAQDVPAPHLRDVMRAVDEGRAQITVQITVPNGDLAVMVDGPGWLKPTLLLQLTHDSPLLEPAPPPHAA